MSRKMTVMVVDDEERLVQNMCDILGMRGFEAVGATSGPQALELLQSREEVDVILLDVQMDGMDGIEVLRVLKDRFPFVQVILHTGNATIQDGIKGFELGALHYVQKPASIEELVDLIQSSCERRRRKMAKAM